MKGYLVFLLAAFVAVQVAYATEVGFARLIGGTNDPTIFGDVYFVTLNSSFVWVWANISGITTNTNRGHGLHVHQYGDLTDRTFGSAGTHYTGNGQNVHACEDTDVRHEGDMGNWFVSTTGTIEQSKTLDLLTLTGLYSIIGKSVVLHATTDNCTDITSAGARLAAGVIGVANIGQAFLPAEVWNVLADNTTNPANSGDTTVTKAVAWLTPINGSNVWGFVTFQRIDSDTVIVQANISGLAAGTAHGFHIHGFGDIQSLIDGSASGSHYNPTNSAHGIPPNATRHAGDMGNICSFANGNMYYNYTFTDGLLTLDETNNVMGRTVVVHAIRDDGGSVYGARIAQGVIGIASPTVAVSFPTGDFAVIAPLCPTSATTTTTAASTSATTDGTTGANVTTSGTGPTTTSSASSVSAGVFALFLVLAILF